LNAEPAEHAEKRCLGVLGALGVEIRLSTRSFVLKC